MEPTGRREAPPDDKLRAIRDRQSRIPLTLHAGYKVTRSDVMDEELLEVVCSPDEALA
jgi:hypothetical protein